MATGAFGDHDVKEEVLPDAESVAGRAAQVIAAAARSAVQARGYFSLALSGGETPRRMLRALRQEKINWDNVHLFQVDERVAPADPADRNRTMLREYLLDRLPFRPAGVHYVPLQEATLELAATAYAAILRAAVGDPPVLDLVHLGLGEDGHTASLVPDDPVLAVTECDASTTALYHGYRRVTLTYPVINRAREILWLVAGAAKGPALAQLRRGDRSIPAARIRRDRALILADAPANDASRTP